MNGIQLSQGCRATTRRQFTFAAKCVFNSFKKRFFINSPPPEVFLEKDVLKNIQEIYRRIHMPKYDFSKVTKQLYWNHTSAWVFSGKLEKIFLRRLWRVASGFQNPAFLLGTYKIRYFKVGLKHVINMFGNHEEAVRRNLWIIFLITCLKFSDPFTRILDNSYLGNLLKKEHYLSSFHMKFEKNI